MNKNKWTSGDMPSQAGRRIVVTGANSGIGLIAAKELAASGAEVIMACRSLDKATAAADSIRATYPAANVTVMQLDIANLASVHQFAEDFSKRYDRLDVLINNAGVMGFPKRTATRDGFEAQFGTNHLGHFALTALLMPSLNAAASARVVSVASVAHKNTDGLNFDDLNFETSKYSAFDAYAKSKLANLLFMYELDRRLKAAGSTMISAAAHPGYSATNITSSANPNDSAIKNFLIGIGNRLMAMPAWKGALPTLYVASMPDVQGGDFIGPVGPLQFWGWPGKVQPRDTAQDVNAARQLWEQSESLTGVRFNP